MPKKPAASVSTLATAINTATAGDDDDDDLFKTRRQMFAEKRLKLKKEAKLRKKLLVAKSREVSGREQW